MKKTLSLLILSSISLFSADSKFLLNNGIVDIGRTVPQTEEEVPKEYIYSEPQKNRVANSVIYTDRLQSELLNCEVDFLGVETCPVSVNDCPSNEEFTESTAVAQTTIKNINKLCNNRNDVIENGVCWHDPLGDLSKKVKPKITLQKPSISVIDNISREGGFSLKFSKTGEKIYITASHTSSNRASSGTLYYDIVRNEFLGRYSFFKKREEDNTEIQLVINSHQNCLDFPSTGKVCFDYATMKWNGESGEKYTTARTYLKVNDDGKLYVQDGDSVSGINPVDFKGTCKNNEVWVSGGYCAKACPSGYTQEGTFSGLGDEVKCHKTPTCPSGYIEESNGTCQTQYTWYKYECPTEVNSYGNSWHVINPGRDCGDASCANSSIPPTKNCVRPNYTCPLDPNQKCGKTVDNNLTCGNGYVWNDNRCERIEKYCSNYTYNSSKDVCEDYVKYGKLCNNLNDVYHIQKDRCVSNTKICENGTYDIRTKTCVMNFIGTCANAGFIYDAAKDECINPSKLVCMDAGYVYDSVKGRCIGNMKMCLPDQSFNSSTNKCEKDKCGSLSTVDSNNRCETVSMCDGVLTAGGTKCIPNVLQR